MLKQNAARKPHCVRLHISVIITAVFSLGFAAPSIAQSVQTGDQFLTLSYSSLERSDAGTQRDATTTMLTYSRQHTSRLRLMAHLGWLTTDNVLPPDRQDTETPTVGLGASYSLPFGTTFTGTLLYGDISESFTTGGVTSLGDGDSLTATIQVDQVVPLSLRTFLKGSASASRSNADFQSPSLGINNRPKVERYTVGLGVTHLAGDHWILNAGVDHTNATNIITITGKRHLDRAKLGATYLINDDTGVTVGWTEGIDAEDTHRRIDLSFTRRF